MSNPWLIQLLAVIRLELRKTFFAKRGIWVYLLALAPVVLLLGHSIEVPIEKQRLAKIAAGHPLKTEQLEALWPGMSLQVVVDQIGEPFTRRSYTRRYGHEISVERGTYRYTDGKSEYRLSFDNGRLVEIQHDNPQTLNQATLIFAAMFQYFDLRLAIFFGCVGIFTNLFRGEMLDKSLHYYMLTPMRREILTAGKFLAGLIATVTIFTLSTALQIPAMLMQFSASDIAAYFSSGGWEHFASYVGITALACVAYGSVFLATGLYFRNPIIPAAVVLLWESVNLFLPPAIKTVSLTYYLESLCPVVPPEDSSMPLPLRLLMSSTPPITAGWAIGGLIILTGILLGASLLRARRLQINYATE